MTPRAKADAKILWKTLYAFDSVGHSATAAEHILAKNMDGHDPLFVPLATSVYILYARPFTDSAGIGPLNEKMVPVELRPVHADALRIRHQMMAHRDPAPDVFPSSVPAPHVRAHRDGTGFCLAMSEVWLNEYKFKWMVKLCKGVRQSLQVEIDRIMQIYLPDMPPTGDYRVNTIDPSGPFFIPV